MLMPTPSRAYRLGTIRARAPPPPLPRGISEAPRMVVSAWLRSETFKKGTVHGEGGFCLLRTRDLWVRAILDCDWSPQTARLSLSMTHVSLTVLDLGRARQGEAGQASSVVVVLLYQRLSPEPSARPFHGSNPLPFPYAYNIDGRPKARKHCPYRGRRDRLLTSTSAPKRQIVQAESSRVGPRE